MFVSYNDSSVKLTGRWNKEDAKYAETTTTGAYIDFAFEGKTAVACFDIESNLTPFPHLWIQLDGGDMVECALDAYLRVMAKEEGRHTCRIIYKGGVEVYRRWYRPLHGKISFKGIDTEKPVPMEEDERRTIEFVGDSITEGVLIDVNYYCDGEPQFDDDHINRVYQDDVCATYAWQVAERLDLRPIFMGYGAVGVTKSGQGKVPAAPLSYPYNMDGSPITHKSADVIMINHGANDRGATSEEYIKKYGELLDVIRKMNPDSMIVALSAFCGVHHEELGRFIEEYNAKNGSDVKFIDSFGWVPIEPLHPLREGHTIIADHVTPILKKIIEK